MLKTRYNVRNIEHIFNKLILRLFAKTYLNLTQFYFKDD